MYEYELHIEQKIRGRPIGVIVQKFGGSSVANAERVLSLPSG